jgi:2-methylcitrate dehydratase PrpD
MPTTIHRLTEFLATATPPAESLTHAAMVIASTLASAAQGTAIASAQITRALAIAQGGRPDASVWFHAGARLPVALAAQVNATLSDAAASDDSDLRNIVHAGTPLTATALAMAEARGRNGAAVLSAIVTGYELAGRIAAAITPGFRDRGFHGCLGAGFAAAYAAARLIGLRGDRMAHAIALAATSIGGVAIAADTSVSREYHAGAVVLAGVNAALAAEQGFTGEPRVLEARRGFFEAFGGVDGATAGRHALEGLGESWDIDTDMAIKLVPGGHPYHALAEAAALAARQGDVAPEDIADIIIARPGMAALHDPLHPADLIDMAHSPAYFTAAGAADRRFDWGHAGPAKIADPVIHRLIDRVRVGPPPVDATAYRQGARVTIVTRAGAAHTATVLAPNGSAALGLDWAMIGGKFAALMPEAGLAAPAIARSLALIRDLGSADSVAPLLASLRA